jgi:phenylalanyl-tRNA synthetase beta chain
VDNAIEFRQMEELARKAENKLLAEVNLFDVYEGKNIPAGKKSYAISFVLSNNDATLNEAQIEKAMERILKSLRENLAAELRA